MGYDYYDWAPYVPVAVRISNAKKFVKSKLGGLANPVTPVSRKITTTFWGNAWCENLEAYSDYENRMPRGRTYIRNGSVVHLEIGSGKIWAYVAGSQTYKVEVKIAPLDEMQWDAIKRKCVGEIGSVVELLQGKLSKNVLAIVTDKSGGLFPKPQEITFKCSCPDFADLCKHVAAVLYGVGVMLDVQPELFFKLRGVDHLELIDSSVSIAAGVKDADTLEDENLESIFGVELADSLGKTPTGQKKKTATKNIPKTESKKIKKSTKKKTTTPKKTTKKVAKKVVKKIVKKVVKKSKK
ncbi:MAG: SWIM zinc finger family protein [Planctomycetaceae bacterium]|jgi:uncharacterized Zn finger protein|nr:SWIM zinc finger family protein [Planctomycetaceae bacterium]